MSTYISPSRPNANSYDDVPFWFQGYLRYLRSIRGFTNQTVVTTYCTLREFGKYITFKAKYGHEPVAAPYVEERTDEKGQTYRVSVDEIQRFREMEVQKLPLDTMAAVSKQEIEMYHYFLTDTLENEASTRNKKLAAIRGFYSYLVDEQKELNEEIFANESEEFRRINCLHEELVYSPAAKIAGSKIVSKQPIFLKPVETDRLLESIDGRSAVRDYAIILTLLVTGIRVSELCAINTQDVSEDSIKIKGKGQKERTVYLTGPCKKALDRYIREYREPLEEKLIDRNALFVSTARLRRLTVRGVEKMVAKQMKYAGLGNQNYTPHKLRHTAATTLVNDGADLLTVQLYLGHESPETTAKYTHLSGRAIQKAVNSSSLGSLGTSKQNSVYEEVESNE